MSTTHHVAVIKKESTMKTTAANLIRWAGLAAMASGILFVVMQPASPAASSARPVAEASTRAERMWVMRIRSILRHCGCVAAAPIAGAIER